ADGALAVERLDLGREADHRDLMPAKEQLCRQQRAVGGPQDQDVVCGHLASSRTVLAQRAAPYRRSAARRKDSSQPGAVIGIAQTDAELLLDQPVGDPLVVGI